MSDLSNLLGDVYGDHSPDGPPVRREPAASERSPGWNAPAPEAAPAPAPRFTVAEPVRPQAPIDDDLAAALSAALNDAAATPAPMAPAPAPPVAMAPAPAPVAPAPAPVFVPSAPPAPVPVAVPVAPAASVPAPVAMAPAAVAHEARFWMRGDDDIFPRGSKSSKAKKAKRK